MAGQVRRALELAARATAAAAMTDEIDIWRAAKVLIERHSDEALDGETDGQTLERKSIALVAFPLITKHSLLPLCFQGRAAL